MRGRYQGDGQAHRKGVDERSWDGGCAPCGRGLPGGHCVRKENWRESANAVRIATHKQTACLGAEANGRGAAIDVYGPGCDWKYRLGHHEKIIGEGREGTCCRAECRQAAAVRASWGGGVRRGR